MAARCAFKLPAGALCDAKKSAPIHLRITPGHHEYLDASKAGLKGESDGRAAYRKSTTHREAMELSAGATDCWPHAYGAPGVCAGPIGPSHSLSRGIAGGLEAADAYPSPPACSWHNGALEQDVEMRAWGERTYYTFNGRQYPFKISREWLTAEREGTRI